MSFHVYILRGNERKKRSGTLTSWLCAMVANLSWSSLFYVA